MIKKLVISAAVVCLTACIAPGESPSAKRSHIQTMKQNVLTDLYALKPSAKVEINHSPGYAVFSNINVNVIFASAGSGFGVAKNMSTGKEIYMKMAELGLGLGLGVKDFRAVFVFHNQTAFDRFVEFGWSAGGQVDAAVKAGDKGGAVAGEVVLDSVTVYQITETGLALQATLKGTKYWRDSGLN